MLLCVGSVIDQEQTIKNKKLGLPREVVRYSGNSGKSCSSIFPEIQNEIYGWQKILQVYPNVRSFFYLNNEKSICTELN